MLLYLDRFDLDAVEMLNKFFRQLIAASIGVIPLRSVKSCWWDYNDLTIRAAEPHANKEVDVHGPLEGITGVLVHGLRHAYVERLVLDNLDDCEQLEGVFNEIRPFTCETHALSIPTTLLMPFLIRT